MGGQGISGGPGTGKAAGSPLWPGRKRTEKGIQTTKLTGG